jgi:hypothetical protein
MRAKRDIHTYDAKLLLYFARGGAPLQRANNGKKFVPFPKSTYHPHESDPLLGFYRQVFQQRSDPDHHQDFLRKRSRQVSKGEGFELCLDACFD